MLSVPRQVERSGGLMYSLKQMKFFLLAFSLISRCASRIRNGLYGCGILRPRKAPLPVISVGNIALGGTEKTPLAMEILDWLIQRGRRPALVSRGYKGRWEKKGGILSDGRQVQGTWQEAGDEPFLIATTVPQAGVFVGKNRLASCRKARESGFDIAVLDDGFQHRRLARDLDIVLDSPNEKIALREPRSALGRADVLLVKREGRDRTDLRVRPSGSTPARFAYSVVSRGFFNLWSGEPVPEEVLSGKRIVAFCGIARPHRFLTQIKQSGPEIAAFLVFPDHHIYPRRSLEKIVRGFRTAGAEAAVTTAKDGIKLANRSADLGGIPVYILRIGLTIQPAFYGRLQSFGDQSLKT